MEIHYGRTDCPSVRNQKKFLTDKTNKHRNTENSWGGTSEGIEISSDLLNVTDGTIQEQTCRTINIAVRQYAMQCNAIM
jgi:hypothetical protein